MIIKKPNYCLYFKLLKSTIINNHHLNNIVDMNEGLENRFNNIIKNVDNLDELINNIKTKRYTYNKINRLLVHILIGYTKNLFNSSG